MIRPTQNQVDEARAVLKAAGFYIDNLWSVWDVYANYPTASEEQAQDILDKSLTNDETMNQIWFSIDSAAENENLERIEITT